MRLTPHNGGDETVVWTYPSGSALSSLDRDTRKGMMILLWTGSPSNMSSTPLTRPTVEILINPF